MEFLAILIVLGLLQLWGSGGPLQRDDWFVGLLNTVRPYIKRAELRLLLVVGVPVLAVLAVELLVHSVLFGLLSLLLLVAVLLFSLGRGEFNESILRYLMHWNNGNFESAYKRANEIGDFKYSEAIDDHVQLHERVRSAVMYEGYERWFAVVFWFLVLGPAGALGYRLSYLSGRNEYFDDSDRQLALRFVHYLDWIPSRLLAFSFALTGNFVHCFNDWWAAVGDNSPAAELLDRCGCAAISGLNEQRVYPTDKEHFIEYGREELTALQSLLSRSVVCWLIAIALLQFFLS